jgi:cbb3-type cytochrome oxidase maturation protein
MSVIYLLLAISIAVAIIFFIAFILSVKSGQYDDSFTPSVRMLFEDELVKTSIEKQHSIDQKTSKQTLVKKRIE